MKMLTLSLIMYVTPIPSKVRHDYLRDFELSACQSLMGEKVQLQLQRIREQGKHFTHKTPEYQLPIQYPISFLLSSTIVSHI